MLSFLPQMSPMWWLTLMITFNIILMIMNSMIFFDKKIKLINNKKMKNNYMAWKW